MGRGMADDVQHRKMLSYAHGKKQQRIPIRNGRNIIEKVRRGEGSRSNRKQQYQTSKAMCRGCKESEQSTRDDQEDNNQQGKGNNARVVQIIGQASFGVLCASVESVPETGCRETGENTKESNENDKRTREPDL